MLKIAEPLSEFDRTIQQLSELVGGELPADYLSLLRDYPAALKDMRRGDNEDDNSGMICEVELVSSPEAVLELNLEARRETVLDPEGKEFVWPAGLLVIGETGGGDYYCLDITGEFPGVLQFEHQPVEFYEVTDSLDEFVGMLLSSIDSG